MQYNAYCPNCDYKLVIEENTNNYVILDNGHPVHTCPNCLIPLIIIDGELRKDVHRDE